MTARENIWLGNIDLETDDKKNYEAAYNASAEELIQRLPEGFETMTIPREIL